MHYVDVSLIEYIFIIPQRKIFAIEIKYGGIMIIIFNKMSGNIYYDKNNTDIFSYRIDCNSRNHRLLSAVSVVA